MSNKLKRNLCFLASLTFSIAIPVLAIMFKYHMFEAFFKAKTTVQLSIIGCIIILTVILLNIKKITEFINDIDFSVYKCLLNGFFKIIPLACIVIVLVNMASLIDDLTYAAYWITGSNIFSLFLFDPLWRYYNKEAKYDEDFKAKQKREENLTNKTNKA